VAEHLPEEEWLDALNGACVVRRELVILDLWQGRNWPRRAKVYHQCHVEWAATSSAVQIAEAPHRLHWSDVRPVGDVYSSGAEVATLHARKVGDGDLH